MILTFSMEGCGKPFIAIRPRVLVYVELVLDGFKFKNIPPTLTIQL